MYLAGVHLESNLTIKLDDVDIEGLLPSLPGSYLDNNSLHDWKK